MNKLYLNLIVVFLLMLSGSVYAQSVVKGKVLDADSKEGVPGVNITVKGTTNGSFTDVNGKFTVKTQDLPITLVMSFIGFETQEVVVANATQELVVNLKSGSSFLDEVVVSASRTAQRKLESPVTIERIGSKEIANSPQVNYYDMIQGLKGVDVTVSSIGFTSITTRGFNTSGNTNLTQLVDGMDNQAPGLNFPLGNIIGLNQLDVDNIELLSGASSALYGSRGLNGTMLMKGKDPFQYTGLSALVTTGVNHVNGGGNNSDPVPMSPYSDISLRWAQKINNKFAYKINYQLTNAHDWVANNANNSNGPGTALTDPNYNGVNSYGSATSTNINPFLQGALQQDPSLAPIINPLLTQQNNVARTGYGEYHYLNNKISLEKINGEARYKITPTVQAIASATYGTGSIVYTNDTRYQIRNFKLGQYRLELLGKNWFLRSYTTRENSGKTLLAGPTAQYINEAWKPSYDPNTGDGWYPQYTGALLQALAGGADMTTASQQARAYADIGRPAVGSAQFNQLKNTIANTSIAAGGTLFQDRSNLYNTAFQYNFSELVKFVQIIAGANWRLYDLNSQRTLFPDNGKSIHVNELSGYAQLIKPLFDGRWTLSGSVRVDNNTLFKSPKTTARATSVFKINEQNVIRASYQDAYSFPSNVQALQSTLNGYNSYSSGGSSRLLNDTYHFNQYQPYSLTSVQAYQATGDSTKLQTVTVNPIKPQSANAFELGYASVLGKNILIDVLGYYTIWKNFIGYENVANTPGTQHKSAFLDQSTYTTYNIAYNGAQKVHTYGYAASISYDLSKNFIAKANFYSDHLRNTNGGQISYFNTPAYHLNLEFGNNGFGKKKQFIFNTTMRYKPSYHYQVTGGVAEGTVATSTVFDAQVGYKVFRLHSVVKLGSTNLTNKYYSTGVSNPMIGGLYYVSIGYNVF